jgi:hypothetical protein
LVVFLTPKNTECALSAEAIGEFFGKSLSQELAFLVVLDARRSIAEKYVAGTPLASVPFALLEDLPEPLQPEEVLLAVGMSSDGTIAARGRPQNAAHLAEMAYAARHMAPMCPDHSRRQHAWGESAPYWDPHQIARMKQQPETNPPAVAAG